MKKSLLSLINSINNNKIKVKYKTGTYSINSFYGLVIMIYQLKLLVRRSLRFAKRIVIYSYPILLVVLCFIIYLIIITPIGIITNKYNNLFDSFWDSKQFLFSSIIIVFITNIITSEKKRHKTLEWQFSFYLNTKYLFNDFIEKFINCVSTGTFYESHYYDFFLTERHYEILKKIINKNLNINIDKNKDSYYMWNDINSYNVNKIDYLKIILNDFKNETNNIKNTLLNHDIIGFKNESYDSLSNIQKELEKITIILNSKKIDSENITIFINEIIYPMYYFIASIRRPWRWDTKDDIKICEILNSKGFLIDGFDYNEYFRIDN